MSFQDFVSSSYFIAISVLFCFLLFRVYRSSQKQNLSTAVALDVSLLTMVFGMLGARAFHIFWENPELYSGDQWPRAFEFWRGGFVYDGGAISAFVAGLIFVLIQKESVRTWSDFFAPLAALGYSLGRLSCLIAGCCFGRSCSYPWALNGLHPTQIYASLWELGVFLILLRLPKGRFPLFLVWVCLHSLGRLMMEYFRGDFRGPEIFGLSIASFLAILFFAFSFSLLISKKWSLAEPGTKPE